MKNPVEEIREALQSYVEEQHEGVVSRAARELEIPYMSLKQWLEGTRTPNISAIAPIFPKIGISIFRNKDITISSDICPANDLVLPVRDIHTQLTGLANQVRELTLERQELRGEIKALERQIERLTPAPEQPSPSAQVFEKMVAG